MPQNDDRSVVAWPAILETVDDAVEGRIERRARRQREVDADVDCPAFI